MERRKKALYIIFIVALLLPLFQMWTNLIPTPTLHGAFVAPEKPKFTATNWFNGTFQANCEQYFNDKLGFHSSFVKMRNTFCFFVFHKVVAPSIIQGVDDYLFEQDYLDAHYGTDYIGRDSIVDNVRKIKLLQDQLAAKGKTLVVFLAPSKADFFPEYIPYASRLKETDSTNHKQFSTLLSQYGVNVIDYNTYYQKQKSKTPYPLYSQYGIHWTRYGVILAADSLIRFIEQKRDVKLNHVIIDKYVMEQEPHIAEYDLGRMMNLFGKPLKSYPLCYPEWHWSGDTTLSQPTLLTVSDSYFWEMFDLGFQDHCFKGSFWYYNSTIYPESFTKNTTTSDIDLNKELDKADIVMIMSTTPGLRSFSWGFLERSLSALDAPQN